ncbi:uncharacterized protein LOC112561217 [Pomacea canaliculata]|uniref:uncharacterized protein LOC112561217 n=1 Tax=Pomacea canaliculata TaxID=400727 RepID=UPI000D7356C0|nr:uncharacterized protein LOC112561217 [Pomacea canaliculata]
MAPTFLVMITLGAIVYILNTQVCTADDDENACFDIDLNCKRKAKKGDCSSDWMNSRCRRSCKICRHNDDGDDDDGGYGDDDGGYGGYGGDDDDDDYYHRNRHQRNRHHDRDD